MTRTFMKALAVAAMMGLGALSLSAPADAGHGWGGHGWGGGHWRGGWGWGGPGYWGAGLIGLGVGAAVGAALTAPAYAGPPPGPYAPVAGAYGPPAWSPEWYTYCAQRYRSFNARTGYFIGYDGQPYFCQ
jgi:hypothetical protein